MKRLPDPATTHAEDVIQRVLTTQYHWTRALVHDLLRTLRRAGAT